MEATQAESLINSDLILASGESIADSISQHSQLLSNSASKSNTEVATAIINSNHDISLRVSELNSNLNSSLAELSIDLTTCFSEQSENITAAITSASNGLNLRTVFFSCFIVLLGAIATYFFNKRQWKIAQDRKLKTSTAEALSVLLIELETIAIEYWLQDYSAENKISNEGSEILIKSRLKLVASIVRTLKNGFKSKKAKSTISALEESSKDLFDSITGGNFESKSKIKSKSKASQISALCTKTKITVSDLTFLS